MTKKSVLITRSIESNASLKELLDKNRYNILESSMLYNKNLNILDLESLVEKFPHIIVTSIFTAQALPDIKNQNELLPRYVWVVGKKSAQILEDKGYTIQNCAKNAIILKNILDKEPQLHQYMLYISGDQITVPMHHNITRKIFYRTFYKEFFYKAEILKFKTPIDYVLLYSQNSAKTFLKLLEQHFLLDYFKNTTYIVLSDKIASVITPYFNNVIIDLEPHILLKH